MIDSLIQIYDRDLQRLHNQVEMYQSDNLLWTTVDGISNSGGNLCLHIVGNLRTFIGGQLGKTGYVRDRHAEFNDKNVSREEVLASVLDVREEVRRTLMSLTSSDLTKEYPMLVFKEPMTTEFFLMHLATHLSYHLGQINYHRRILEEK